MFFLFSVIFGPAQHAHLPSAEGFYPQNRPCTPKLVGTFYMQGYKVKEKTAIVPPVSKLSGHPATNSTIVGVFLWYCWLFVSIVLLQFDSQSPSLCSNDSFSFLIFFFNYFDFFIHFFYSIHWFSFIAYTGFLCLFAFCFALYKIR